MNIKTFFQCCRLFLGALALVLVSACGLPVIEEARRLGLSGQHELALSSLKQAIDQDAGAPLLRQALLKQQAVAVDDLAWQVDSAIGSRQTAKAQDVLRRLKAVAPNHVKTLELQSRLDQIDRHQKLLAEANRAFTQRAFDQAEGALRSILVEDRSHREASVLLARIERMRSELTRESDTWAFAASQKLVSLDFNETPLKEVFSALERSSGLNFVFDKEVRLASNVTFMLHDATVNQALEVLRYTQQLGMTPINDNTLLVFPSTQQKRRDVVALKTRDFFLTNTDPKQVQALIKAVVKTRDVVVDERLNMVTVKDSPEALRLIERLIQSIDLADPEVVLDVEVIEVSTKSLDQLGLDWPDAANYGSADGLAAISSASGLRWFTSNPLAVVAMKASAGSTRQLANPTIRARSREKAKVLIGEKLPVFTTTSTASAGVSSAVTYQDVGLKLEVEPVVQLDNDITIKVALEVSSLIDKVAGPQGVVAYQIGTRQANSTLRLKDGETQILAGLVNDNDRRTSSGLPGVHDLSVVGRLFGVTDSSQDKTEVVLLLTPHIVRNLMPPAVSAGWLPSGTDNTPGVALLTKEGQAGKIVVPAKGAMATANPPRVAAAPVLPRSAIPSGGNAVVRSSARPTLLGPEEVMAGDTFEIAVNNPTKIALKTQLTFDANILALASGQQSLGRVDINVPAGSERAVTFRSKLVQPLIETVIGLEGTTQTFKLHVRDPNYQPPPEPEPEANPDPSAEATQ